MAVALLDCHKRLSEGKVEGVDDQLLSIAEYIGLRSDVAMQMDLDRLATQLGYATLSELRSKVEENFEVDEEPVPLLILPRGDLEAYTGKRHSIDGALRAVAGLQKVDWSALEEDSPMRELKEALEPLVQGLVELPVVMESGERHEPPAPEQPAGFGDGAVESPESASSGEQVVPGDSASRGD